jgi:hypothetical protein
MPADPIRQRFRAQQAEDELLEANRLVTMAVQWQLPDGSTLLHAGGVWDKIDRCYLKTEPDVVRVIRLKQSQVVAAQWLGWWLQERAEGRKRDFRSLFLLGDRGGGKSFLACVGTITALIKFPTFGTKPTLAWQVVSSFRERREIEREIADNFPFEGLWYIRRLAPEHEYRFVNGALLVTQSADNKEALRQGTVDFLYLNEATKLTMDTYIAGIPRLKDHDGLCIATTNPPKNDRGRWVKKLYDTAAERKEAEQSFSVRFVDIKSEGNDSIDHDAADDVADQVRVLDPRAAAADIDGQMLRIGEAAYGKYSRVVNRRPMPDIGDITRDYLRMRTGRAYDYLGGMDFQGRPHMVAVVCKIFGTLEDPQLYFCDEIISPQATEGELADDCKDAGYTPDNIYWIGDNSGQWQNGKHLRHEHDSFKEISNCGFHIAPCIKPKSRDHRPGNPPIEQRVGLINKSLTIPRLFVACELDMRGRVREVLAPKLADGFQECDLRENRHGRVVPVGVHAHITDAAGYPVWWVYSKGRRKLGGSIGESVSIERVSPIG